jgi:hypothetical protein
MLATHDELEPQALPEILRSRRADPLYSAGAWIHCVPQRLRQRGADRNCTASSSQRRRSCARGASLEVASCNEELANLKREEQAVESLVADLARVLEEIPVDATQSFGAMRGKLPWPGG